MTLKCGHTCKDKVGSTSTRGTPIIIVSDYELSFHIWAVKSGEVGILHLSYAR